MAQEMIEGLVDLQSNRGVGQAVHRRRALHDKQHAAGVRRHGASLDRRGRARRQDESYCKGFSLCNDLPRRAAALSPAPPSEPLQTDGLRGACITSAERQRRGQGSPRRWRSALVKCSFLLTLFRKKRLYQIRMAPHPARLYPPTWVRGAAFMFDLTTGSSRDCSGVSRRQFLRIGGLSTLGLTLSGFLRAAAKQGK